jgi:hypothetical protein
MDAWSLLRGLVEHFQSAREIEIRIRRDQLRARQTTYFRTHKNGSCPSALQFRSILLVRQKRQFRRTRLLQSRYSTNPQFTVAAKLAA